MHMSLFEFPLYLILIPRVEVGLDADGRAWNLFRPRGGFAFDVHDERNTSVEVVERGRAGELRGNTVRHWPV